MIATIGFKVDLSKPIDILDYQYLMKILAIVHWKTGYRTLFVRMGSSS
jgi:hypothetical protein